MACNCNGEHDHNHEHHEGCGCHDEHHHEDTDIIYLTLEDGSELKCKVVVVLEVEDKEYIALLPDGEENVFIYKYKETEEGPELDMIEDENEFDKVAQAYNALAEGEFEEEE